MKIKSYLCFMLLGIATIFAGSVLAATQSNAFPINFSNSNDMGDYSCIYAEDYSGNQIFPCLNSLSVSVTNVNGVRIRAEVGDGSGEDIMFCDIPPSVFPQSVNIDLSHPQYQETTCITR